MKNSKHTKKVLALVLASTMIMSITACGQTVVEDVDTTKSQLYVANYTGGVGEEWLENVKTRFERKYAETSFEKGKTGVQIMTDSSKDYTADYIRNTAATSDFDVYFTSGADYFEFKALNLSKDITSLIKEKKGSDGKTIYDKMYAQDKEDLLIDGKYYAIPHAEFYLSLQYDAGVFKNNCLYFSNEFNADGSRKFVASPNDTNKSCGPDGKTGTYDDGMPSSYEELYKVVDAMLTKDIIPFVHYGNASHYTNLMTGALMVSYLGADGANILYDFKSDSPLEVVSGFNGDEPIIATLENITVDNANKLMSSSALYYAIEFCQKIFSNANMYYWESAAEFSHLEAQNMFAISGLTSNVNNIAFLIDGSYWYSEATEAGTIADMQRDYPESSKDKDFKMMPLPIKYKGTVKENEGRAPTLLQNSKSFAFINNNIEEKNLDLAYEFLSFCYTDDELVAFTETTDGLLKQMDYDYSKISNISGYAQSVLAIRSAAKEGNSFLSELINHPIGKLFPKVFSYLGSSDLWKINTNQGEFNSCLYAFQKSATKVTVKDAFKGMQISDDVWARDYLIYNK